MIIDLDKFLEIERPFWNQLEKRLGILEDDPAHQMTVEELKDFQYLYERAGSALSKISTFAAEPDLRLYLETLVSRAYSQIHEAEKRPHRLQFGQWISVDFPRTFRRYFRAFQLAVGLTILGAIFGSLALQFDPSSKAILMPFSHLLGNPSERVAQEESMDPGSMERAHGSFSSSLFANNTRVSINALALGITYGLGTIVVLFYNGVILGVVVLDYIKAGESVFLAGWLLPHGSIEIPAILIAGQAGLVLAGALIGRIGKGTMGDRLRSVAPDLLLLMFGVTAMLVWAALIESFFSQFHAPLVPYSLKIAFGLLELAALVFFLWKAGASPRKKQHA